MATRFSATDHLPPVIDEWHSSAETGPELESGERALELEDDDIPGAESNIDELSDDADVTDELASSNYHSASVSGTPLPSPSLKPTTPTPHHMLSASMHDETPALQTRPGHRRTSPTLMPEQTPKGLATPLRATIRSPAFPDNPGSQMMYASPSSQNEVLYGDIGHDAVLAVQVNRRFRHFLPLFVCPHSYEDDPETLTLNPKP